VSGSGDRPGGHQDTGPTAEAIALLERTLADRERALGDDHPSTRYSRNNLGMAYREAGRTAEAITLLERALADCERVLGTNDQFTNLVRKHLVALTDRATHDTGKWLGFGLPGARRRDRPPDGA
jgi:hypothetical protein